MTSTFHRLGWFRRHLGDNLTCPFPIQQLKKVAAIGQGVLVLSVNQVHVLRPPLGLPSDRR